ncbi:MAG: class I SAM-dependent methyltransferase family protein [Euryarchaeota archaeon]|nr:class I SAM-dependent methyltransferase family protein [Euryarchaeota archaeon]
MLGLKVEKKKGEKTRKRLMKNGTLVRGYRIKHHGEFLIFPVDTRVRGKIVETEFEPLKKRESVEGTFDVIGSIAIVEDENTTVLRRKNIRSIYKKETKIRGTYRTRAYSHLAGEKKTETVHREYGCRYLLDITKVYFNPRLATERYRVTTMVKSGERVLDMFAGVGPFSILIAKEKNVEVHSVDINPDAVYYLKKNIELNKVSTVLPHCGDCREVVKKLPKFDRIIMNLPKSSLEFMDTALSVRKKQGTIHLYSIETEEEIPYNIIQKQRVKSYAPGKYVWRYDIRP